MAVAVEKNGPSKRCVILDSFGRGTKVDKEASIGLQILDQVCEVLPVHVNDTEADNQRSYTFVRNQSGALALLNF